MGSHKRNFLVNFKETSKALIEAELEAWRQGERLWNVSNQFNETILNDALKHLDRKIQNAYNHFSGCCPPAMELARYLSEFKAPEIDRIWVD